MNENVKLVHRRRMRDHRRRRDTGGVARRRRRRRHRTGERCVVWLCFVCSPITLAGLIATHTPLISSTLHHKHNIIQRIKTPIG